MTDDIVPKATEPDTLSFSDFLPDERTPEQINVDVIGVPIHALMDDDRRRDSWVEWVKLLDTRHRLGKADKARFDIALRQALSGSTPPKRAVCGLIFTKMGWWEPKASDRRKVAELALLRDMLRIEHLKPASHPTLRANAAQKAKSGGVPGIVVFIGLFLLFALLMGGGF